MRTGHQQSERVAIFRSQHFAVHRPHDQHVVHGGLDGDQARLGSTASAHIDEDLTRRDVGTRRDHIEIGRVFLDRAEVDGTVAQRARVDQGEALGRRKQGGEADAEAGSAISAMLQEINAETMKDMGRAMAALKERLAAASKEVKKDPKKKVP